MDNAWSKFKRSGAYKRKRRLKYKKMACSYLNKVATSSNSAGGSVQEINFVELGPEPEDNEVVEYASSESDTITTDEDEESEDRNQQLNQDLRKWAIDFNISHNALKGLLEVINKRLPNSLPKDPRTLLKTDTAISVTAMGTGHYWHNSGWEKVLIQYLQAARHMPENISLYINIDGLPVAKSSKSQVWPILCSVHNLPKGQPIVMGIYSGDGKPQDLKEYLRMFVDDMKRLTANGLTFKNSNGNELTLNVKIRAFICDSPARAFIKGVCNFNARDGCLKCTVQGEYSHISHTVVFTKTDCLKRNDQDFRAKMYGRHHKVDSPLLELPIDMIEDIIVSDSLHLLDLGIMKRLLFAWRDGKYSNNYDTKWYSQQIAKVTEFLVGCKMPKEIHRAVRGLGELCHWKGSEFRTFLYYLSFIILKNALKCNVFHHFLCFFCAVTICSNEQYFNFLELAKELMIKFVKDFKDIYGKDYMTSNIHNLIHVVDEVKKYGKLQEFSAYPFENCLYTLKRMIRHGNKPLHQIARRISEKSNADFHSTQVNETKKYPFIKKYKNKFDDVTELHLEDYTLSTLKTDKWFLNKQGQVIEIQSLTSMEKDIIIEGLRIDNLDNVFEIPIKSSYLNIYQCDYTTMEKTLCSCRLNAIKCKLVSITYESKMYFAPLLHTMVE